MVNKRTLLALLCVFALLFANAFAGQHGGSESSSMSSCSSSEASSSTAIESSTASQGESSSTGAVESSSTASESSSSSSCMSSGSTGSESSSTGTQSQGESSSTAAVESSSTASESSSSSCESSQSSSSSSCGSSSQSSSSSSSCMSSESSSTASESSTASQGESSSTGAVESSSTASESSSCSSSQSQTSSSSSSCASSSSSSSNSCSQSQSSSSSSSCGSESSSSSTGTQSQGESSSSGAVESSTAEESQDCGRGTYSATGFKPCLPCPNNTYANLRETECTPCPANTHIPEGTLQDSLTRCVCDDGYSSLWASGGPCYPSGETPSYEYCGQRTYSETGNAPCQACPNNTYANYAETECHSCPDHSHILGGGVGISITECVCDDGYTSQWATGGPCYAIGSEQSSSSSSTGEQGQGESSSSGAVESSSTGSSSGNDCSSYTDELSCKRDSACKPIYAHMCSCGKWQFAGCESADYCDNSAQTGTCATDSEGDRAWFPTRALPSGWTSTTVNKKCGSCCHPDHQRHPHRPSKNETNVGTGCSFVNGSACVLIEFRGSCPATSVLNEWRINIIEAVATIVSEQLNVSRAAATIGLTVGAIPQTVGDNTICAVHVQIFPPTVGDLTATDFLEAIWNQLGGDSLISGNQVAGIAGVRTYGDLAGIDETDSGSTVTSGALAQASVGMMAVATTVIATIW